MIICLCFYTEPKPQRSSIDEEEEEEKDTPVKTPAPQPASKPGMRKPPGGIGLGPMVLPGLGTALGGAKLKVSEDLVDQRKDTL